MSSKRVGRGREEVGRIQRERLLASTETHLPKLVCQCAHLMLLLLLHVRRHNGGTCSETWLVDVLRLLRLELLLVRELPIGC